MITNLFIAAFGGPTEGCCKHFDPCPGEAYCFVSGVFGHNPARKQRIDEVVEHYKALGGFSKFNEITEAQADALGKELAARGKSLNITVGYDHWMPYIADKVGEMAANDKGDFLALIMSPHQSSVSWDGYLRRISEGLEKLPEGDRPKWAGVVEPYWNKPGLIEALAEHTQKAADSIGADLKDASTRLLLSAHSVPESIAKTSDYVMQVEETAKLTAEKLGAADWKVVYQSGPTDSRIPWTGPFLEDAVEEAHKDGATAVVATPIGFLCDNVEVLYDMGIEGKEKAEEVGVKFAAAEAVNTHPAFIAALADQVVAAITK